MNISENLHAVCRYVPAQAALSLGAYAAANVFNLAAAAAITTVALKALALVTAAAFLSDLLAYFEICDLTEWIPLDSYSYSGGEYKVLGTNLAISTVGLFALGLVAAPVAQFGLLCGVGASLVDSSNDAVSVVVRRVYRRVDNLIFTMKKEGDQFSQPRVAMVGVEPHWVGNRGYSSGVEIEEA